MFGQDAFVHSFAAADLVDVQNGVLKLPPLAVWGNLAIYIVAWALLMWPQHLPLGRPCIAMVFAAMACGLRELCHKAWPEQDYPTVDIFGKINPTPIALLFGLMLVNAYLKDTGIWKYMEERLDTSSPTNMLLKLCCVSAATSAVLTNDTTCLVLTPVVLNLCRRRGAISTLPFLMAVATSSNIGSSLTIIGNPQNALIASISPDTGFLSFMKDMLLPVMWGLSLNTMALWCYFRKSLVFENPEVQLEIDVEIAAPENRCLQAVYVVAVGGVVFAMIVGWMLNMNTDDVALAAGSTLMLIRAVRRRAAGLAKTGDTETQFALGAIDYSILILFIGQFILVGATVDTGLPQRLFHGILGPCADNLASGPLCMLWFSAVVLLLSNVISNVPVILMLQPLLATQPAESVASIWTACAWVATVSGNLTMLGSAANLIVAHTAESEGETGFVATSYSKFSLVPTLVITCLGVLFLPPIGPSWGWILGLGLLTLMLLALLLKSFATRFGGAVWEAFRHVALCGLSRESLGLALLSFFASAQLLGPYEGAWLTANSTRTYNPGELGALNAVQQVVVAILQPCLGCLVDACHGKRRLVALGSACALLSAAIGVFVPQFFWLEMALQVPTAISMTLVPLALNSLTLGAENFTRQVALNNVGLHLGAVLSSGAMCLLASVKDSSGGKDVESPWWSAVPMAACVLTIVALPMVRKVEFRADGVEAESLESEVTSQGRSGLWTRKFFIVLALCFLFNFSNMAQLQLLVQDASRLLPGQAINFTSAAQVIAHVGMLLASVVAGRLADFGRKPLVVTACLTVTIRALLTAATDVWYVQAGGSPWLSLLPCETLDGVCAGLWLMLMVLMAKDVSENTGCFSLALGCLQAAFSVGAIFSSELAGILASRLGFAAAFLSLAVVGMLSFILALLMPETQALQVEEIDLQVEVQEGSSERSTQVLEEIQSSRCERLMTFSQSCRSWIA
ncbi:unnamed protein product [Effrenium voratum]|uniref:Major facilitator superfamily (MFS) profile domain-containing protein n=1 Tax=Effrenium voratum TaxID=2562239 RepID=A0AA36NKD2_9DINO|nr:unnamed protein product [Effrenium voratum]CAJ1434490.1 unnamed protein product [Effrenium voratum]